MEHQHPLGTGSGIASREAEKIKKLIIGLNSTIEVLDAEIGLRRSIPACIAPRVRTAATSWPL
jgi:hypothetical protein